MDTKTSAVPPGDERTGDIINESVLLTRIPISRRTLTNWKRQNVIPFIRVGGRIVYHWPSVESALLRRQNAVKR